MRHRVAIVAAITVGLVTGQVAVATAASPSPTEHLAAAVTEIAPDAEVVAPDADGGALAADTASGTVVMPSDGDGQVVVRADGGIPIAIGLPDAAQGTAKVAHDGTVVYADDATAGVTVQATDAGARISAVLPDAAATDNLGYAFDGLVPNLNADGSVTLAYEFDGISMDVARIDTPWAADANGQRVPTHYAVDGSTVTQVLDLKSQNISYPIVADPAVQADCGIITCTVRFNRNTTNNIMLGSGLSAIMTSLISGLAVIAGAAVAAVLWPVSLVIVAKLGISSLFAAWAYNRGNCLGYKILRTNWGNPLSWSEVEVKRGSYNCS